MDRNRDVKLVRSSIAIHMGPRAGAPDDTPPERCSRSSVCSRCQAAIPAAGQALRPVRRRPNGGAARAAVGAYHEAELTRLIERVREALVRFDAGEIDAFELDDLIHHYKRAAQKLWTFCTGAGAHVYSTARTLEWLSEQGELPDWWEQATPPHKDP